MLELFWPYLYGIMIYLYWAKFKRKEELAVYRILGQFTVLFITQQPIQINIILNFLKCKILDDDHRVIANNPEISCYSSDYLYFRMFFVYPAFLLWILIYPGFIMTGLRKYMKADKL